MKLCFTSFLLLIIVVYLFVCYRFTSSLWVNKRSWKFLGVVVTIKLSSIRSLFSKPFLQLCINCLLFISSTVEVLTRLWPIPVLCLLVWMWSILAYNVGSWNELLWQLWKIIGYEPTDLTVHPPPLELSRVGSFFSYRCLVFPKNVLKGNPE